MSVSRRSARLCGAAAPPPTFARSAPAPAGVAATLAEPSPAILRSKPDAALAALKAAHLSKISLAVLPPALLITRVGWAAVMAKAASWAGSAATIWTFGVAASAPANETISPLAPAGNDASRTVGAAWASLIFTWIAFSS